jgi:hypothetical protein
MFTTITSDINIFLQSIQKLSREDLHLFEYRFLSTNLLKNHFQSYLKKFSANKKNVFILVLNNEEPKGFCTCEYSEFDSEIFGFNLYKISNFSVLGGDFQENENIMKNILNELFRQVKAFNIKHIIFSLNQNIPNSQQIFNYLIKNNFYYINTLLTFKLEKREFRNIKLSNIKSKEIIIREATEKDVDILFNIALKSYRINRLHLDKNLDKEKCDLLYAVSAKNSIINGYADVIFVAEDNGDVIGYYSGKKYYDNDLNINIGNAIISAVDEKARGRGVFSLLNDQLLKWFHKYTDLAEMGTYIINHPVHRVWTKNRLSIVRGSHQLAWYQV